MAGLEGCTALEELYLSHNGIATLEGLATLTGLKVLDVSSNRLTAIQGIAALSQLEDLWLNDNGIVGLEDVAAALSPVAGTLTTLYLANNPASKEAGYKPAMRAALPALTQLDADYL
jgi:protein phosphatase 1 regulatory subunit 7